MQISDAIRLLLTTHPLWARRDPRTEINRGGCEGFMLAVCKLVSGAEERTTGPFMGPNGEEIDGPFDHVAHYWIFCNGRHYDAEAPGGVDQMEKLPIFARAAP